MKSHTTKNRDANYMMKELIHAEFHVLFQNQTVRYHIVFSYRHNASETERKLEMKKLWTWMDGWEEVEMIGIYFERHFPLRQGTASRNHGGFSSRFRVFKR